MLGFILDKLKVKKICLLFVGKAYAFYSIYGNSFYGSISTLISSLRKKNNMKKVCKCKIFHCFPTVVRLSFFAELRGFNSFITSFFSLYRMKDGA